MTSFMSNSRLNSQFQPILLKGHERSITTVKYNADGDLLFTASKDSKPNVWYSETGERLGTYDNHKGAVWDLDPSWDSKYLVTGCGDANARLFELTTGKIIARMPHKGSVRAVTWGEGTHFFATASDPFTSRDLGTISIFEFPSESDIGSGIARSDDSEPLHVPTREIYVDDMTKVMCLAYTIVNQHIIAGFDNGTVVKYDSETGQEVMRKSLHHDRINRINFNRDKSLFITASSDKDAKLVDPVSLEVLKVYRTPAPVNGAVISPTHPHVLIGGGQDAMKVTVTSGSQGKFETRLFHMLYEEEFGRVKGHFGPINALAIHPYGKSYASGAEDGFIRIHHFDSNYMNMHSYIPDDIGFKF